MDDADIRAIIYVNFMRQCKHLIALLLIKSTPDQCPWLRTSYSGKAAAPVTDGPAMKRPRTRAR